MPNIRNSKPPCNRNCSIYSKIEANYSCNYLGHGNCEYYSNLKESTKGDIFKKSVTKTCKEAKKSRNKVSNRLSSEVNSIGSAVGLTCSTTPIVRPRKCLEKEDLTLAQDFAIYLKAFALIYVLPEEEWTSENMDKLLLEGEDFFQTSSEEDHADGPLHQKINNNLEKCIKRKFKLEGYSFTLELKPPYLGEEKIPMENRAPHIISNLKSVLQGFFRTAHYCLLLYKAGYLLIWRRQRVYFVMDVKGRRREDFVSVKNGVAMLICLQTLNNLVHLISNLSGVSPSDKFSIRELAVVTLVTADGRVFLRESNHRPVDYKVIDQNYAYLTSHLHLSLNPDAILRNRSSLIVGVAAILSSKIEHPASWNTSKFDRLICYGAEFYRNFCGPNVENDVSMEPQNFPKQLHLGQFVVSLKLDLKVCSGQWIFSGISSKVNNNLEKDLLQTLQSHGNALFQINNQTYALWIKDNFFYLLDPYRHTVSTPQKTKNGTQSAKWATVRMFRDFLTMLSVFHQLLKESNRQSTYSVHVVHIKNIVECPQGYIPKLTVDDNYDVKSLNETIEFSEQPNDLEKLLSDISDYEPEIPSGTEEESLVVNKFKLASDKDKDGKKIEEVGLMKSKTKLRKSTYTKVHTVKNSTRLSSRSTSPIGKKLGSVINLKTVSKHSPVKSKSPKPSLTKIKLENDKDQNITTKPTNPIPKFVSTRRKGVWPAKATDNLSALRQKTSGYSQTGIGESSDFTKNLNNRKNEKRCETDHSQTSFQSARLPPEINYPIYTKYPHNLAVVGSESGTMESLKRLLNHALKVSNRVLTMTPWGNYVVFKHPSQCEKSFCFYLFDGCTCNIDRFRHLDLRYGTAGLLPFETKIQMICYMIDSRETRATKMLNTTLEDSSRRLEEFMGRGT